MIGKPGAAAAWWHELQPSPDKPGGADRAALARLRRCASVAAAMQEPPTIGLFRRVEASHPNDLLPIALTARASCGRIACRTSRL